MKTMEEKLSAARERRLSDDGGLATMPSEEISVAQFNSGAIALRNNDPLRYIRLQQELVKRLYEKEMLDGVHYGTIPGCGDTPAMKKAGAELILGMFGYSLEITELNCVERWDDDPLFAFTHKAIIRDRSGQILSESIGRCNSREKKHRYRWVSEKFATDKQREQAVGRKKNDKGYWIIQVPNPDIYDIVNTVSKVSQKRAYVGAALLASNCSSFFVNAESAETMISHEPSLDESRPQWDTIDAEVIPNEAEPTIVSGAQVKRLFAISKEAGHSKESLYALMATHGVDSMKKLEVGKYDAICTQAGDPALAQFYVAQTEPAEPTPALDDA